MKLIRIADALAEREAVVSVIIPAHIASISTDKQNFSRKIIGGVQTSISAHSHGISAAAAVARADALENNKVALFALD